MNFDFELFKDTILWRVIWAAVEVVVGFILGRAVRYWILKIRYKAQKIDPGVLTFTSSLASLLIRFLAIVIALAQLGVNIDVIVGATSAIGLGISLAMRDSMANVASGVQILITHPFRVGDFIRFEEFEGECTNIEMMFTTLTTYNNEEVVIPNSELTNGALINYSKYPWRRIKMDIEVALDKDYDAFEQTALERIKAMDLVLKDPETTAAQTGFSPAGNALTLSFFVYVRHEDYWTLYYQLVELLQKIRVEFELSQPYSAIAYYSGADLYPKETKNAAQSSKKEEQTI